MHETSIQKIEQQTNSKGINWENVFLRNRENKNLTSYNNGSKTKNAQRRNQ
jgi:hypothetical protein